MVRDTTPVGIEVTLRNIEFGGAVEEYVLKRLGRIVYSLPNLRAASVVVTFEGTRPADEQFVVQVTLAANGTLIRAEDRGPTTYAAIDSVHDLLDRRIRDWKGRVYYQHRREAAAYQEAVKTEATRLRPEDQTGRIVRKKSHEIKPMFPEDAIDQMELLGHDFYFFLNAETDQYNVVYRRKAGGYGLIEPALAVAGQSQG